MWAADSSAAALALGQSATCTITNDDQPAQLTLVKTVTNDNGGTALPTASAERGRSDADLWHGGAADAGRDARHLHAV